MENTNTSESMKAVKCVEKKNNPVKKSSVSLAESLLNFYWRENIKSALQKNNIAVTGGSIDGGKKLVKVCLLKYLVLN